MVVIIDYYDYQKKTISDGIRKEIDRLQKSEYFKMSEMHQAYVQYITSRINHDPSTNIKMKNITKLEDLKHTDNFETTMYNKPWHRLKETHKKIKFREFVAKLKYKNEGKEKNKEKVLKDLLQGLDEKKFGQNKVRVEYDAEKMKIIDVQCLGHDKKKDIYVVSWD
jgi:hypothetical protein